MKETEVCEFNNLPDDVTSSDKYEIIQVLNNYAKTQFCYMTIGEVGMNLTEKHIAK